MQGISAIITDQMTKFHAFKAKVFSFVQATTLSTICRVVLKYMARKGNIQTDTKHYTSLHPFWSVDKCAMLKNDLHQW
jgi:hypothetical protein